MNHASVPMLSYTLIHKTTIQSYIVYISALACDFIRLQLSTGLEPNDVRNAQVEFRKFDMENNGKTE